MAIHELSVFSLNETIKIGAMDLKEFHEMFAGRSANAALKFRRELQKALRTYANHWHTFDIIQKSLIAKCQMIEKWCRIRFYKEHIPKYLNLGLPMISAKAMVRKDWEDFIARKNF